MTMRAAAAGLLALVLPLVQAHAQVPPPAANPLDIAALVPRLLPSVVNILARHDVPVLDAVGKPLANGAVNHDTKVGSGYVIDPEGLILTNRHVTDGATEIWVTLLDGTRLRAALAYRATGLDLAMLRIRPKQALQPITWGDSEDVVAGDWVVAIGNPLGLGFSVSHGIVSALDRDIKETPYDSFIQVDAAINPGNSGGPLFDLQGRMIGMNTAFDTVDNAGGSVGLGFAIPGDDVRFVVDRLRESGRVPIGTAGVTAQKVTQEMAYALGLPRPQGVVIDTVAAQTPPSPLRVGDVVLAVDGAAIANTRGLVRRVAAAPIGASVPFLLLRDGGRVTVAVPIAEAPSDPANRLIANAEPPVVVVEPDLGLTAATLTDAARTTYHLAATTQGVVLSQVTPSGTGASLGFALGDVVLRIDGTDITSRETLLAAVDRARTAGRAYMMVLKVDVKGTRWIAAPVPPAK